jgi:hypothetical protein
LTQYRRQYILCTCTPWIGRGRWQPAGLSLKSPRFLSNQWGPPHNDWYREGYKNTGADSFTVSWEAERGGQTYKGADACKYSNDGKKLTCSEPAFTEVYDKVK